MELARRMSHITLLARSRIITRKSPHASSILLVHLNLHVMHCRWEASRALKARLASAGYNHEGAPGTWSEALRIWRECKFIEDEGEVVFYKNARGFAARQAVFANEGVSDSGIDIKD